MQETFLPGFNAFACCSMVWPPDVRILAYGPLPSLRCVAGPVADTLLQVSFTSLRAAFQQVFLTSQRRLPFKIFSMQADGFLASQPKLATPQWTSLPLKEAIAPPSPRSLNRSFGEGMALPSFFLEQSPLDLVRVAAPMCASHVSFKATLSKTVYL